MAALTLTFFPRKSFVQQLEWMNWKNSVLIHIEEAISNSAPPIGTVQQLSKALGNNTKIISNNTNIGNPNVGKAASAQQKVTSPTAKNGLPSNPTKGSQKSSGAGSSAQQNNTTGSSNMTNATAGTTKSSTKTNSTKK